MKKATMTATLTSSVEKVWEVVTDLSYASWRSDLKEIRVSEDGKSFIEITKEGFETTFVITEKKPFERYAFDIKNKNMTGHWVGIFSQINSGTAIEFTEEVTVSNPLMNLLVSSYLKKQQKLYLTDLKKALGES